MMMRGGKRRAGHRGGEGYAGHGIRGSRDDQWDSHNPEDDPLRVPEYEGQDPASDEYVWPQFDEEED